jgi:hypothetical protein
MILHNKVMNIHQLILMPTGDGDSIGRGTGIYLDVYNQTAGTSVDVFERKMNIKFNAYQPNKPYNIRGTE